MQCLSKRIIINFRKIIAQWYIEIPITAYGSWPVAAIRITVPGIR